MTPAEKRKQTMLENIMRAEALSLEHAENVLSSRMAEHGRKGGKATGDSKTRGGVDYYRDIGRKGSVKRWQRGDKE